MATAAAGAAAPNIRLPRAAGILLWPAALAVSLAFYLAPASALPRWAVRFPRDWQPPLAADVSAAMAWLVGPEARLGPLAFKDLTRGLAWLLDWPLALAKAVLVNGFVAGQGAEAVQLAPPLPWLSVLLLTTALGAYAGGPGLAALVGGCFLYLAVFGQWASAMTTLASIVVAVPLGAAGGLLLGIAGYRSRAFERAMTPVLDLMQTVPIFAYLVPILFLFGFGPVAAMIATVLYAIPPMIRVTILALRAVPEEVVSFGRMAGCTRGQLTWRVLVPVARPGLMLGVNQVIMLSLNMVIVASMIGAGGLGFDVLSALRRLDIGHGLEAGLAITLLAIALDRLSQALAAQAATPRRHEGDRRHAGRRLAGAAAAALLLWGLAHPLPALATYPAAWQVSTAPFWDALVRWLNLHLFDDLEAFKTVALLNLLVPVKRFLLAQPWPWMLLLLSVAGWRLGGWRLAVTVATLACFVALAGQWENAMITVYLCGVSVVIAALIGIPAGIAGALRPRFWRVLEAVTDLLQTLPSFVYLIPVVMLFRVGDFTAMIAIVLYAVAPALRYTAHGLRHVPPPLVEAGIANGCTKRQLLTRIRLPLALPEILLGLNQTIMLAVSMLVITALVGTRDLGQEVYMALAKADVGRGVIAGLCVAAVAMIADRLLAAGTLRLRRRLGLA
ncbi:ABC transporter permease [Benzoatithermus flavus]|uniref:ABC transporter permease subunit n=1 Tax=Benzoatithermus flavus TaxID=3108223 RepID=A0ABU8XXH4_9PROT